MNEREQTCQIIDIGVPRVREKEEERIAKYQDLDRLGHWEDVESSTQGTSGNAGTSYLRYIGVDTLQQPEF